METTKERADRIVQELAETFSKNYNILLGFAIVRVTRKDIAEDLVQEAYVKVHKSIVKGLYQEQGALGSYLQRALFSLIYDFFRKRTRAKEYSDIYVWNGEEYSLFTTMVQDEYPNVEEQMTSVEVELDVHQAIEAIENEDFRRTVKKFYLQGHSCAYIAEEEGVSINTVLGRLRYGRKILKETLQLWEQVTT